MSKFRLAPGARGRHFENRGSRGKVSLSFAGTLLVLFTLTATSLALPAATNGDGPGKTSPNNRANSRQLTNSIVPNAGTGFTAGSTSSSAANSLDVLRQHLAATTGNNPLSVASELQAQAEETMQLQNAQNQQNLIANVQAQKQQVATAQAALTSKTAKRNFSSCAFF